MNYVLDIMVVAVVALFVVSGFKRGIISTVVHFLGAGVSAVASSILGSFIALYAYDNFIKNAIIDYVAKKLPEITMATQPADIANGIMEKLPDYAANFLNMAGIDAKSLTKEIAASKLDVPVLVETLVRPITLKVTTIILTLALFIVFVAIISLFTQSLTSAIDLTGLGTVNRILGAVLGFLAAAVIIMVLSLVLYLVMAFIPIESSEYLREGINNSYIYKLIYSINLPEYLIAIVTNGGKL